MTRNEKVVLILSIVAILLIIGSSEFNYYRTQREFRSLSRSLTETQQTVEFLGDRIGQQESIIEELRAGQSNIELTVNGIEGTVTESNNTLRELTGKESTVDGTIGAIRGTARQLEDSLRITLEGIESSEEE